MGYTEIKQQLMELLQIKFGQTTPDERFTLLPNACLGICDHAPALMIDNDLYKDLKATDLSQILNQYL
jgi:NADH-quinone oxidoreductase subunit E